MLAEIESWPSARFAPIPKYEPEAEPIFLPTLTAQADPPRTGPAPQDIACPSRVAVTQRADRAESRAESHRPRSGPAQQDNGESHGPRSRTTEKATARAAVLHSRTTEKATTRAAVLRSRTTEKVTARAAVLRSRTTEKATTRAAVLRSRTTEKATAFRPWKRFPLTRGFSPGPPAPRMAKTPHPHPPTPAAPHRYTLSAIRCPLSRYPLTPVFPITCPQPQSLPHITREAPAKCPVSHT